jgi:uroporphyrinogen III methyltransferase/synthase
VTVYLVGAGPGDPGLLTVRGAEVLARADVVLYDRLSVASLLDLAPADALRVAVGKTPRGPSTPQEEINRLLVEHGRAGSTVVRLKGGDPFVFARGGEEAAALREAGIAFEVVPGVTSAIAVPAYGGVPVTQRGMATSFTVVTGHEDPWAATETDWDAVARVGGTIVVLMGVATRAAIAERLMAGGLAPATPVAATTWGTRPEQRTVRTTLGHLGDTPIGTTSVIVVGAVAGLDLGWFESRPLFGRRVVVTRARAQASGLSRRLAELGAEVVEAPLIETAAAADGGAALRAEASRLAGFDWVVVTSSNAVDRLFAEVRDARALGQARVAAVGPATADALTAHGVVADLVPGEAVAEALLAAMGPGPGRVLLPQAAGARPLLRNGLAAAGWEVVAVDAYRTVPCPPSPEALAAVQAADAVTFASSSTVTAFVDAFGVAALPPTVVSIGPATSRTAVGHGIAVTAEADPHTVAGLVAALVDLLGGEGTGPGGTGPTGGSADLLP